MSSSLVGMLLCLLGICTTRSWVVVGLLLWALWYWGTYGTAPLAAWLY